MKIKNALIKHTKGYLVPTPISYWHTVGFVLIYLLVLQIITGIFLAAFYTPDSSLANLSIQYLENEISNGWLIRRCHIIGASFIFAALYLHFIKALYYKACRYKNRLTYWSGLLCWYLIMGISFTGYILPWGQMSFWGATVITNLLGIIPVIGETLVKFVWGSSVVGNLTLKRFFVFHFLLPAILIVIIYLHLWLIHSLGNTPRVPSKSYHANVRYKLLYPNYIEKDILSVTIVNGLFIYFVCFNPFIFDNPVNNLPGDALVTPKHIVPEWYFLPFYLILKLISVKWLGILAMFFVILFPIFLPLLDSNNINNLNISKNN